MPSAARPPAARLPRGTENILVVEDNDDVREMLVEQLASLGYRVVEARSGDAAAALLKQRQCEFDLVFADIVMPGEIDGAELARWMADEWPTIPVLLSSGFDGGASGRETGRTEAVGVLRKPYRKADLARAIRAAIDDRR
jgi:CheY-like chemotaxis protein